MKTTTTVQCSVFLAVIIVLQYSQFATADDQDPPVNNVPIFDACEVEGVCGRGRCVHVSNNTLGFECDCEPGWRQARLQEDVFLTFLPCVFPNCTLNYTCTENTTPGNYDYQGRTNITYSDSCSVENCGGGRCNITSPFTRACLCEDGYYNLLNSTLYPCYRRCEFGNECSSLGFSTNTSGLDPNPFAPLNNNANAAAASLIDRAEFVCLVAVATTLVRAMWNYRI